MTDIINSLNNRMEKRLKGSIELETTVTEDGLAKYKEYKEKQIQLQGAFDISSSNGDLCYIDRENNVTVILESEELSDRRQYRNRGASSGYNLNIPLKIEIKYIDEENRIVYVRCTEQRATIRERCIKALNTAAWKHAENDRKIYKALEEGKEPPAYKIGRTVRGNILSVDEKQAVVDILGLGIIGEIAVNNWSPAYVERLDNVCKVGENYLFEIKGFLSKKKRKLYEGQAYSLSRKHIAPDPWNNIPKAYIDAINERDTILLVTCKKIISGQTWFWGSMKDLEGIDIFCDYPNKFLVEEGKTYRCVVKEFAPERHNFKVIPIAVAQTCDIGIAVQDKG